MVQFTPCKIGTWHLQIGDWNSSLPFLKGRREQHCENTGTNFKHFLQNHGQISTKFCTNSNDSNRSNAAMSHLQSICLSVCLKFIVPLENFSLIWRRHHCRWRAANFDLCSALMAIEQWGFFNVLHLLRQGPTVYNSHLRGPVTLTPVAEQWSCHYTCFYDRDRYKL